MSTRQIADFLKEERILLNLEVSGKEEAIREIANLLVNAKEVSDFDPFLKDVFGREKMATTGIGHEVAIPHARTRAVKDFVIAFGRSRQGVEFNSLDNRPAKLIFLMGTPREKGLNVYLKILAHLNRLLEKESFRNLLLKAASPKEIIDLFREVEN